MTRANPTTGWAPRLSKRGGPAYLAIADALESDLRAGVLAPGDPLPTQRELADRLGVNFTTVTRAYTEAKRRGLLTATVGRGTFASDPGGRLSEGARGGHDQDMSVNAPPVPRWLPAALRDTVTRLGVDAAFARNVLTYETRLGDVGAREAAVTWLRGRGLSAEADRVVVTAGAQHALALLLSTVAKPGDVVLTESLAYPGLFSAASMNGVRLTGVDIDHEGLRPDSLDSACKRLRPKALFCVPTFHNPTTAIMSLERRREILAVARRHRLRLVEDDIAGPLRPEATPLAKLSPDTVIHLASLSKCVAPGLRTAFVLLPTAEDTERLEAAVRTSVLMLSPIALAVSTAWVGDGTALRAATDIRNEMTMRAALARDILGERLDAPPGSLHGWLHLPTSWSLAGFVAQAQQQGIRVAPADWYVTGNDAGHSSATPNAVRLTLGAAPDRATLERALRTLAAIVDQPRGLRASNL